MMAKNEKSATNYAVPAVDNMLDIAEFLIDQSRPVGVTELSRELGISNNFVFRIMKRLLERGYAEFDEGSGGYRLGSGFFSLGTRLASRFDLRLQARDILVQLSLATAETCQVQIPDGDKMRVLDSVSTQQDFFLQIVPGLQVAYNCSAFGKCVLAFWPEEKRTVFLQKPLEKRTPRTITNPQQLLEELQDVRKCGVAYDREEHTLGLYCVGAPIFDVNEQVVGGIGVSGLAGKYLVRQGLALEQAVLGAAGDLSAKIGYAGMFFKERQAAFI